jgi:transcriptional regulator with XRE-family HTH domain
MLNKQSIGKRIKEARQFANITQNQIAKELGIKQQAYSRFETGVFEVDYEMLIYLCNRFKVSADYLLGIENEDGTRIKVNNSFNNNNGNIQVGSNKNK